MKKILSLVLVLVLAVCAMTSCNWISNLFGKDEGPAVDEAIAYLGVLYNGTNGQKDSSDYDVVSKVMLNAGADEFDVTWTSSNASIVIKESSQEGYYTVDLPATNDTEVEYTLTATVTNANGDSAQFTVDRILAVYGEKIEGTSVLEEGVAYKLYLSQNGLMKHLFATHAMDQGKYYVGTEDYTKAPDFFAEKVDGGYAFYTMIDGAKKYVDAYLEAGTDKDGNATTSKRLRYADTTTNVWTYDADYKCWCVTLDSTVYMLGTYNKFATFCISEFSYITGEDADNQYPATFITADQAANLPEFPAEDLPTELTPITEILSIGANLTADTTELYRVQGVIDSITSTQWGNMIIKDADGNTVTIYGLYSQDGATRYDAMDVKPQVGDTITVVSVVSNFKGTVQLKNARLFELVPGEVEVVPVTPPTAAVPAPTGKYHIAVTQGNVNKNLYLTGATANKDYYLATTEDTAAAMLFEVEAVDGVDGAFRIFFYNAEQAKTYIEIYQNGDYTNLKLTTEVPATYYTYDEEYNTAVCELTEGNKFYLGAYSNYETISASAYNYISTSFPAVFVEVEAPEVPEPADPLANLDGNYVVNFIMDGAYQFAFNKEAGSFTLVDNIGNFDGTYTYTYDAATGITVAGDVSFAFEVAEDGSITVSIGGGSAMPLLVAGAGDDDDEDDGEEATILEPTDVKGTITLEATDTYCYIDLYGFKAPAAGTYWFLFEEGTGLQTKDSYDAYGAPEVEFYDGGVFSVTLEEGEVCYFYFAALMADTYEITYSNEEIIVIPPVELATGANTLTFTADNLVTGIECVFTPYANGTYTFKSDVLGANIYDESGMLVGRGSAELESYCEYTVVVYPLSEETAAGDYVLNIVAPIILGYNYDNTVELDADQIANGFSAYITPYNPGKLSLTSETLTLVSIVDENGNELVANEDGSYDVLGWTKYTVYFEAKEGAEAGEHTIVPAFVYAPGTAQNPYTLEATNNVVLVAEGNAYYQYVATANGYLSISGEATNLQFRDEDYNAYLVSEENSIFVMAGETYLFTFSTTDYAAIDTTVTASFVEGEITEEILKGMLDGSFFYINDEYMVNFENGMITVSYMDYSTWEYTLRLAYSYTVTANEDGTLTILPTYVQTEGEIGVDFGFSGCTVTATEGEYGYEFTHNVQLGGADEPTSVVVNLDTTGADNNVALEANTYAYAELYIVGNYKISWDVEGLEVIVNNVPMTSGSVFYAASPRVATVISISGAGYAAVEAAVLTIAPYVESIELGDNTVTVNNSYNGEPVKFTAEAAGTYVFTAGANTLILVEGQYGLEPVESGVYTVALEAGASASFSVTTADNTVADVAINVVKDYDTLTIPEAVAMGNAAQADSTEKYYISGVITSIASTKYGNVYIVDAEGNEIYVYGLYDTANNRYDAMESKPAVGQTVKLLSIVSYHYTTGGQLKNATVVSCTDDALTDVQKVAVEKANCSIETSYDADTTVDLIAAGATCTDVAITWTVNGQSATQLVIAQTADVQNIAVVATFTAGNVTVTKEFAVVVSAKLADNAFTTSYTFSDYAAGTQYAENEAHVLDEYVTCTTTQAHFTTQLRLYSSSSHDGYAIFTCTNVVDAITFNAGNKVDTLNVYGSTDGSNWTLISGVSITSTDYTDYALDVDAAAGYTYIKLDVAGTQQVRVASIGFTFIK